MTGKYTAKDIFFLDFSLRSRGRSDYDLWDTLGTHTDYDYWEELQKLFNTLRGIVVDGQGFWGNRNVLASDTKNIVIAIERTSGKQLGFLYAPRVAEEDTTLEEPDEDTPSSILVFLIQSFEQRKNIGTLLVEYLARNRAGAHIVIDHPLEESCPFWSKFLNDHSYISTNDKRLTRFLEEYPGEIASHKNRNWLEYLVARSPSGKRSLP